VTNAGWPSSASLNMLRSEMNAGWSTAPSDDVQLDLPDHSHLSVCSSRLCTRLKSAVLPPKIQASSSLFVSAAPEILLQNVANQAQLQPAYDVGPLGLLSALTRLRLVIALLYTM